MRAGYLGLVHEVDAVIVHTREAARRLAATGLEADRIHHVPHGLINTAAATSGRAPRAGSRLVLLQFGKIKPYKGVDVLLEALALVPPALRGRLEVRIVGKPYLDTAPLERFVAENGLQDTVRFRFEFVDQVELDRLLGETDAILLPYREIDASGVAMTAIARGLPVLASAIEGFEELFEDGRGACLVPPGRPDKLADVLRAWAAAPEMLDALAMRHAPATRRCAELGRDRWPDAGRLRAGTGPVDRGSRSGRRPVSKWRSSSHERVAGREHRHPQLQLSSASLLTRSRVR